LAHLPNLLLSPIKTVVGRLSIFRLFGQRRPGREDRKTRRFLFKICIQLGTFLSSMIAKLVKSLLFCALESFPSSAFPRGWGQHQVAQKLTTTILLSRVTSLRFAVFPLGSGSKKSGICFPYFNVATGLVPRPQLSLERHD
jgi:hypothetical protein